MRVWWVRVAADTGPFHVHVCAHVSYGFRERKKPHLHNAFISTRGTKMQLLRVSLQILVHAEGALHVGTIPHAEQTTLQRHGNDALLRIN